MKLEALSRSTTALPTLSLRKLFQSQIVSSCFTLFVQYSLLMSVSVLPFCSPSAVSAQESRLATNRSTTRLMNETVGGPSANTSVDEKHMAKLLSRDLSGRDESREQDPPRPTVLPPTPGMGHGGPGERGTFNVDSPDRVQGPPPGVESADEVLNRVRTPSIPDPIPSTESYCWPGDPACRKRPQTKDRPAAPRPTPPPRSERPNTPAQRPDLLVASNDPHLEKLLRSIAPNIRWDVASLLKPYSLLRNESSPSRDTAPLRSTSSANSVNESGSASYLSADCTTAYGYADGAQLAVYIYVDSVEVGSAWADNGSFSYDISAYMNDGAYHSISAWYYDYQWQWLEAGSTSVSGCFPDYDFCTPRLNPKNETGDPGIDPGSQNINWSIPLVELPGRGVDLNLSLTYNSLVWTKSSDGGAMLFDPDHGFPSPGFRLRFPIIQPLFFNSSVGVWSYMLVDSMGGRVELRQINATTYESADNNFTRMVDTGGGNATVWLKDGTQLKFEPSWTGELRCREIKDRNGNLIKIDYTPQSNIDKVTDTLGRQVVFNYDANHRLLTITQQRTGLVNVLISFGYQSVSFNPSFPGMNVISPGPGTIPVLSQVGFADGSRYNFEYSTFGQVNKIRRHEADNRVTAYVRYNMGTGPQTDCPRFSEERIWAEHWNNNQEALTSYSGDVSSGLSQVTTPDNVTHKQFYHTSGWRTGLVERSETWSGGVRRNYTEMYWTQDNEGLPYQLNPRPNDIRVIDEAGNQRRITIAYTSYGLPANVREYSGAAVVRRRELQYRFDAAYVNRRILGVIDAESLYEGESTLMSKIKVHYDATDGSSFSGTTPTTGHDSVNYGAGFILGRANATGVRRYNVQAPSDDNQAIWIKRIGYNAAGSPFLVRDAVNSSLSIGYTDSFSDNINRGTLAHPTTVTDADNFVSTFKYHYDTGAPTRSQDPKGAVETTEYDTVGRVQRVTNEFTSGYTRFEYPIGGELAIITRIDGIQGETMSVRYTDGGGRVRGIISHLPGSSGQWRARTWVYDIMGRLKEQSNPTEVTQTWIPTGDDVAGWVMSQRTYDWLGRPRVMTNQDGSTRELTYTGCGCAGGDVITLRDERGRRRKLTNDVLGRLVKVEELNWDTSVYSTSTYAYNARDQLTQTNQAGQLRTFTYDNHQRLLTRVTPEQGTTTYGYFADDTVHTITDARNAVMTFGYNGRKLVTGITFSAPSGVAATPNVSFQYDQAGNRTSMSSTDSTVTYGYDTASRLTSESRTFNGLAGSFTLSYDYNRTGRLTEITNPWNVKVGYTYNMAGELTGVTGQNYAGVTSYANGLIYRAAGGMKQMNYGNGRSLSLGYNNRMFVTQWSVPGVMGWNYAYNYFNENTGRVVYAQNLTDPTLDRSYDYDHVGRPTHFTSGSNARHHTGQGGPILNDGPYSQGYTFDVWGNRTYIEGWGGIGRFETSGYTNNTRNGFTYDAAGNLTNDLAQVFTYDATGQQATASYSGYLLQQTYDGDRLRVKMVENSVPTYYLRSTMLGGAIVAEINSAGSMNRGFVYLGDQLLAVQQNNQVSWVHQDPVVKSKRVTNSSGAVVSVIELDPWGGDTSRSSNAGFQPRRFNTYDRDGNASDEAMHRRYNRWHSRFDQPDPYGGSYDLTDPQSLNRYSYALNDPVNLTDPTGLDPQDPAPPTPPTTPHIDPATGQPYPGGVPGISASTTVGFSILGDLPNSNREGNFLGGDVHFTPEAPPTGDENHETGGGGGGDTAPPDPEPDPTPQPDEQSVEACIASVVLRYAGREALWALKQTALNVGVGLAVLVGRWFVLHAIATAGVSGVASTGWDVVLQGFAALDSAGRGIVALWGGTVAVIKLYPKLFNESFTNKKDALAALRNCFR